MTCRKSNRSAGHHIIDLAWQIIGRLARPQKRTHLPFPLQPLHCLFRQPFPRAEKRTKKRSDKKPKKTPLQKKTPKKYRNDNFIVVLIRGLSCRVEGGGPIAEPEHRHEHGLPQLLLALLFPNISTLFERRKFKETVRLFSWDKKQTLFEPGPPTKVWIFSIFVFS